MPHFIAVLCTQLLRLLLPAHGRHRAVPRPVDDPPEVSHAPRSGCAPVRHWPHRPRCTLLRGEGSPLVRPYVLSLDEWRHERRQQRQRRRTLWLAVHGIDIGPRRIHGVKVAA
ncbi:hypothetical protein [Streptomyces ureilyticus]|uniref:Secreted protein n=1 Tax=Streptomyces ureilyticus TaxID=1775131 RepID=A0ABX0DW76_9ACTN|nr:hypothetical protein [Streptomyces ureilyticus]NGO43307.1 hypothetical protein [Streptomyces ureilyticus]